MAQLTSENLHAWLSASAVAADTAKGCDGAAAEWANAPSGENGPKAGSFLTELGVIDVLTAAGVDADAFLTKLEAMPGLVARIVRILQQSAGTGNEQAGVDFGLPTTQAQLQALATADASLQPGVAALIAFASRPLSRAEVQFGAGTVITADMVSAAYLPYRPEGRIQ